MNRASSCIALLPLLSACGGNVVIDSASAGTGTHGSTTSVGTSSASGGVGGAPSASGGVGGGVLTTTSASTSATVGAGGSSASCGGWYFELTVDNAVMPLSSSCSADMPPVPLPFAQVWESGPAPGYEGLFIDGCATPSAQSLGIIVSVDSAAGPGTYLATVVYHDPWNGLVSGFQATIDQFGPVGSLIVGSFQGTLVDGSVVVHSVYGKFSLCRAPDQGAL
jgi:hypothetical protein